MKSTAAMVVLPSEVFSLKGKLLPGGQVQLNWEATLDNHHQHFEVEHSVDGYRFNFLGKGPSVAPFQYLHNNPSAGNNFYRIKLVDKHGRVTFSRTIAISVAKNYVLEVFPNPVQDKVQVKLYVNASERMTFDFTDAMGRLVHSESLVVTNSGGLASFNLAGWQQQVYYLKVVNARGEIVATQRISKL
jgi:hypothetical protein